MFIFCVVRNENYGKHKGQCIRHDECKLGFHCGKDNCLKTIEFEEFPYDCCEKCKKFDTC